MKDGGMSYLLKLAGLKPRASKDVVFVHGMHGDEPAGSIALEETATPGVDAGNHTGERKLDGKDLNRHVDGDSSILKKVLEKKPKLVVDLHEDRDSEGVYAYSSPDKKELVKRLLKSVGGLEVAKSGDGEKTDQGVISNGREPYSGTLEKALAKKKIPYVTLETPGKKKLKDRVNYQKEFINKIKKADIHGEFQPDYTPNQLKEMGAYGEVYGPKTAPRLASLPEWPQHWYHPADPHGWLQWYKRYSEGRRMEDDERQIKRWKAFKARHGGNAFRSNPTPRRAYALRNWAIDPTKLVKNPEALKKLMDEYRARKYNN